MKAMTTFRVGIWSRLLFAFTTVVAITVIVGAMALLILERSDNLFEEITVKHVPEVLKVAEFAEIGGEIVAIAPSLLSAGDDESRKNVTRDIESLLMRLDRQVALLNIATSEFKTDVDLLTGKLKENLISLQFSVTERLELERLLSRKTERLRWLYSDLIGELDPLSQDYAYNFDTELEKLIDASKNRALQISSARLQANRKYIEAIEQIRSSGVLLVGLMAQASTSGTLVQVENLAALSGDAAALLRVESKRLSDDSSTLTLKQVLGDLFLLAEGNQSVFTVREKVFASDQEAQAALTSNREYVRRLRDLIDTIVAKTQEETFAAVESSRNTLVRARLLMVLMVILSLAVTFSVLWFYVRGSIVARLTALSRSMLAIAGGDLASDVPEAGSDEIGKMSAALRTFRDTAVAVEEANAQAIIDNAAVGLIIAFPDGVIHFINPMAAELFGCNVSNMTGLSLYSIVTEEDKNPFSAGCVSVLGADKNNQVKFRLQGLHKDGEIFPIEVFICGVLQRNQKRLIVTVQDVRERERAEELLRLRVREKTEHLSRINIRLRDEVKQRRKAQNELIQAGKLAALGQLSAGIAHEMNQPLSAMRYYIHNAEKLLERGELSVHRENLSKVTDLIDRMAKMISHLKTFARWQPSDLSYVDPFAVLQNAYALIEAGIKEHNVQIDIKGNAGSTTVWADAIRLEQVFVNIISNAIDAVVVNEQDERRISVEISEAADMILITVMDNGQGINVEILDRIFDPFFTTKEVGQGLGLGLSISYNIIKGFGGSIETGTTAAGATWFTVSLLKENERK